MMVVKIGGSVLGKKVNYTLIDEIKEFALRKEIVLVHGGGDEVTNIASKLGKEQIFITSPGGIRSRYTDKETAEIYTMVMVGKLNKAIVTELQRRGVNAVGLCGIDGMLIKAERKKRLIMIDERGRKRIIDGGYTGKIVKVNSKLLNLLIENNYTPVVSPVAIGDEYEMLNVDGDRAAAYVAGALKADYIIFLTDVKGVIIDNNVIKRMSLNEAEERMKEIGPGMITKVLASIEALKMGVKHAIICPGNVTNPLNSALNGKTGTHIVY
jgi:acetylglutamate/LysW-gamma-L-alpha-aminoadipate kinase